MRISIIVDYNVKKYILQVYNYIEWLCAINLWHDNEAISYIIFLR